MMGASAGVGKGISRLTETFHEMLATLSRQLPVAISEIMAAQRAALKVEFNSNSSYPQIFQIVKFEPMNSPQTWHIIRDEHGHFVCEFCRESGRVRMVARNGELRECQLPIKPEPSPVDKPRGDT
jgi:hypothetical protein